MPQAFDDAAFEIDHVVSRKHGGPTQVEFSEETPSGGGTGPGRGGRRLGKVGGGFEARPIAHVLRSDNPFGPLTPITRVTDLLARNRASPANEA